MAKHLNTKHENYVTCDICGTRFSSTILLTSHKDDTNFKKKLKKTVMKIMWALLKEVLCGVSLC